MIRSGDGLALQRLARGDHIGLQSPSANGGRELLDQLGPVGQHKYPPALGRCTLNDRADGLPLAGAGGHDGADPAVDLEGRAEIFQQLPLVVAQEDRGHGMAAGLALSRVISAMFKLSSLARHA